MKVANFVVLLNAMIFSLKNKINSKEVNILHLEIYVDPTNNLMHFTVNFEKINFGPASAIVRTVKLIIIIGARKICEAINVKIFTVCSN